MTTEEKVDHIYQAVMDIKAQMSADKTICEARHDSVNERIHGLHRVVKGNGQPGLEQKHETLTRRFDRLEARVLAWVGVGTTVGAILGPLAADWVRGGLR